MTATTQTNENFATRELRANLYDYEIIVRDYYSGAKISGPDSERAIEVLIEDSQAQGVELDHKLLKSPLTDDVDYRIYAVWL